MQVFEQDFKCRRDGNLKTTLKKEENKKIPAGQDGAHL